MFLLLVLWYVRCFAQNFVFKHVLKYEDKRPSFSPTSNKTLIYIFISNRLQENPCFDSCSLSATTEVYFYVS